MSLIEKGINEIIEKYKRYYIDDDKTYYSWHRYEYEENIEFEFNMKQEIENFLRYITGINKIDYKIDSINTLSRLNDTFIAISWIENGELCLKIIMTER